jgi:hemerythrin-like metal-binding protein
VDGGKMYYIEWNEGMSVGVRSLDVQHQSLIGMINRLHDAMKNRRGSEVLDDILQSLVDYTSVHFKTEEIFFKEYEYPDAENHCEEHESFIKQIADISKKHKEGIPMITMELMQFLKEWLVNHIKGTDMKYRDFFISKSIQ